MGGGYFENYLQNEFNDFENSSLDVFGNFQVLTTEPSGLGVRTKLTKKNASSRNSWFWKNLAGVFLDGLERIRLNFSKKNYFVTHPSLYYPFLSTTHFSQP